MGAAAAWALARRPGFSVTLLEQFALGHARGSSHGRARIFRLAYEEDDYVAFAGMALAGWRLIEHEVAVDLLAQTGAVDHGDPAVVGSVAAALERAGIAAEMLSAEAAAARWPGLRFDGEVLFQPDGGRVDAEAAVAAFARAAVARGAVLRENVRVADVEDRGDSVAVELHGGVTLDADLVVIAAGAWTPKLVRVSLPPITPTLEQPVHCRALVPEAGWPSFVHYGTEGEIVVYGLAEPGAGIKFGEHGIGAVIDPDSPDRAVDDDAVGRLVDYAGRWIPGVEASTAVASPCIYVNTPTHDPVIDRSGRMIVATGFSGHGFKFAPAVGRLIADLAQGGRTLPRFRLPED
jgi:sarcosine oxidase